MIPKFNLRGLVRYDARYDVWMGLCLETGAIVTADDPVAAKQELLELLDDETSFAIRTKNLRNLFSSPAEFNEWESFPTETAEAISRADYRLLFQESSNG